MAYDRHYEIQYIGEGDEWRQSLYSYYTSGTAIYQARRYLNVIQSWKAVRVIDDRDGFVHWTEVKESPLTKSPSERDAASVSPRVRIVCGGEVRDANRLAFGIVREATEEEAPPVPSDGKDPAAVALGRRGGLKGGRARAESLTPERRQEIARNAVNARWHKHRQSP